MPRSVDEAGRRNAVQLAGVRGRGAAGEGRRGDRAGCDARRRVAPGQVAPCGTGRRAGGAPRALNALQTLDAVQTLDALQALGSLASLEPLAALDRPPGPADCVLALAAAACAAVLGGVDDSQAAATLLVADVNH